MEITRREFMKASAATGAVLVSGLGFDVSAAQVYARELRIKGAKETTSICCFCSVGCGLLVSTRDGKVINIEGDPEHPISEGSLCSKGSSIFQVVNNPNRVMKPRYRAPGAGVERGRMGLGAGPDRAPGEGHARPHVQDDGHLEDARAEAGERGRGRDPLPRDGHRHAEDGSSSTAPMRSRTSAAPPSTTRNAI